MKKNFLNILILVFRVEEKFFMLFNKKYQNLKKNYFGTFFEKSIFSVSSNFQNIFFKTLSAV
jgi:hypothetical protein